MLLFIGMKIGIEAERANIKNPTGVERYAQQLILNLAASDRQNTYILYLRSAPAQWISTLPENFKYKVMPFPIFWTQLRISWEMLVRPVDCLFIMASALPIIHPKNSVVTIHDVAWEFYPETFGWPMLNYLRFSTWYAVRFARKIIAVSEQTKKDLIARYHLPAEKIALIYHGFSVETPELDKQSQEYRQEQAKVAALPKEYIVFVSTLQPRKNVVGLIEAFIELKKEKNIAHSLVLVGAKGWLYQQIMEKIADHPEVIYAGYAIDRLAYIRNADLLVQPSFYEGFGMSLLDAFAMGVPVACSKISSLPEVAGPAAQYFDPHSKASMRQAIYKVITDRDWHDKLIALGKERLALFSWQKCAEQTLKVLTGK